MTKIHPQVERAILYIEMCIIDFLIKEGGSVSFSKIEKHTGLREVGIHITAEILSYMALQKILVLDLKSYTVYGNVEKLSQIKKGREIPLPPNHNKLWSDQDIVIMCEMHQKGYAIPQIAKKLGRSENAIKEMMNRLRLAYRLIPIIKQYSVVRDFCEKTTPPKPGTNLS